MTTGELVDLSRLIEWMDAQGLESGPLGEVTAITGGTQNVLLRFTRGDREFVFRRPPPHKRKNSDETMRREARILAALAGSDVPHPALIAACPDAEVLGAAFYLMEPIDGFNATLGLPEPHASDPAVQRAMGFGMADGLLALTTIDPAARGIADLGRFEGWAERQVGRWRAQLDGYSELDGYAGPDIPGVDAVGTWLDAHRPREVRAGLIHGDFHFANVLIRRDSGALAAIVDWELATIGDPLLDLGHLLATWPVRADVGALIGLDAPGLPGLDDIIEYYGARTDRDLSDLTWFRVLACYRLGLILEGTHARAGAGLAPVEVGDTLHAMTVGLLQQAVELISGGNP
ncbi:MAG: phosphotransferase family protein [Acidimicrobiia bacterium]|nr:phosphotransferase family protein [Acidimicrobiia bacterium]